MKKSRYSEEQIATALRQVEAGAPIPVAIVYLTPSMTCRDKHGATFTNLGSGGKVLYL
jgi:hypothetical protein